MRPQINLTGQKGVERKYGGSLFRKCLIHFCVNVTLCLIYLSTMCVRSEINSFLSSDDLNTETSRHQKVFLETWKLGATSFGVIYKPSNTSLTHTLWDFQLKRIYHKRAHDILSFFKCRTCYFNCHAFNAALSHLSHIKEPFVIVMIRQSTHRVHLWQC